MTFLLSRSWHLLAVGDRYLDHKIGGLLCAATKNWEPNTIQKPQISRILQLKIGKNFMLADCPSVPKWNLTHFLTCISAEQHDDVPWGHLPKDFKRAESMTQFET